MPGVSLGVGRRLPLKFRYYKIISRIITNILLVLSSVHHCSAIRDARRARKPSDWSFLQLLNVLNCHPPCLLLDSSCFCLCKNRKHEWWKASKNFDVLRASNEKRSIRSQLWITLFIFDLFPAISRSAKLELAVFALSKNPDFSRRSVSNIQNLGLNPNPPPTKVQEWVH